MSLIVHGEQGCGKSAQAKKIAAHYGLDQIIEEWSPGQALPANALALTNADMFGIDGAMEFGEVMKALDLDPIYDGDDYPRAGCELRIRVGERSCSMSVIAPGGRVLEGYGPPHAELPRMIAEWLSGKAPKSYSA